MHFAQSALAPVTGCSAETGTHISHEFRTCSDIGSDGVLEPIISRNLVGVVWLI